MLAILALVAFSMRSNSGPSEAADQGRVVKMDETIWRTIWTVDAAGSDEARRLTIFRPSLKLSGYRLQFSWRPREPVGCILRWRDAANYYGIRMRSDQRGPRSSVVIDRFQVVNGTQRSCGTKVAQLPAPTAVTIRVAVDVAGPVIKTILQNQVVDYWSEDRFRSGAAGFFSERGTRSEVEDVRISAFAGQ